MADTKISALTAAALPLAGTEVLPIVQSGATVKVATDNLTVKNIRSNATSGILQIIGPAAASTRVVTVPDANFTAARTDASQSFTGDQTLSTGNLIQGTAAKGFNFNANTNAAGMTSELLNWYEEGTWTPTAGVAITSSYAKYTRVGRKVSCICWVSVSANADANLFTLGGLPFAESSGQGGIGVTGYSTAGALFARQNNPTDLLFVTAGNGNVTNSALSGATFALMYEYFV